MSIIDRYEPNTFCWSDLSALDPVAAKAFYTEIFGWEIQDTPMGDSGLYTMFLKEGREVCGLSEMTPEMKQQGMSAFWMSHLSVTDINVSTTQVTELGGQVLQAPFDVMTSGKMAIVQDPQGSVFSLWEPAADIGSRVMFEPNTLCWNELQTSDIDQSKTFYHGLCEWTTKVNHMPSGFDYFEFQQGDISRAGMMAIQPEWENVPSNWSIYFDVEDCDQTASRIESLGGRILMPPTQFEVGRIATVSDPQGAVFSIMTPAVR